MQKIYIMKNLDCANCAAKIEAKFNALPEVEEATITFTTRQLRLRAKNPDGLIPKLTEIARTVENEVEIHPRETDHHHHDHHNHHESCCHGHDCTCGHEHHEHNCTCEHEHHEHDCGCGHDHHHDHGDNPSEIMSGAALFVLGLLTERIMVFGISLSVPLFISAYLILGREIIVAAVKNLTKGHVLDENFLMSIATLGAFAIGDFAEAVGVMLFYQVGAYFEEKAVERSRSQIMEAIDLRPEVVILESGKTIPAADAQIGNILIVRPGDRIPLDGVVLKGESRIDTAPITGEPVPVGVHPGDQVTSGCVNVSGQLTMRVERPLSESMVTRILNSVENAAASKPKIDRFITRFARIYTPIVVALAVFVALVPSLVTGNWNYWVYTALSFLVMSCPCALVLSVPLAFFSGIGVGSKRGILFKGGASIEALSKIRAVVMDKTGTLTRGDFRVQEVTGSEDVLALAASCEQHSSHPIAISIVQAAKEQNIPLQTPEKLEEIAGRGICAMLNGREILCGNEALIADHGIALPNKFKGIGTRVIVAIDGIYAGNLLIADTLKPGAKVTVNRLKQMGLSTAMLTGDTQETADGIAADTGIDQVHAHMLPEDKLSALQNIRTAKGAVMYVGDGINDAPVLAGADVGAAMGSGADAAIEAADVVFMTSDIGAIPEALTIAQATAQIAWQNVVFALAIKAVVMILGLLGHASMWMAVFADSGVAMLCVINSIHLLYKKK